MKGFDRNKGFSPNQTYTKKHAPDIKKHAASTSVNRGVYNSQSFVNVVKGVSNGGKLDNECMLLDDSSDVIVSQDENNELELTLIGGHKDFRSIANFKIICRNEGFTGVEVKYLGESYGCLKRNLSLHLVSQCTKNPLIKKGDYDLCPMKMTKVFRLITASNSMGYQSQWRPRPQLISASESSTKNSSLAAQSKKKQFAYNDWGQPGLDELEVFGGGEQSYCRGMEVTIHLESNSTDSFGNPEEDLKDYAIIDSGCSGSMTGYKDKLSDFKEFKGGYVAFGNDSKGGRISGKETIKTSCLDFEKVSYVEELKFNLLSVSQICDKKHNVLFIDKECLILSPKFKFVDEDLVILRAPRKNDVYSLDLKNIIPSGRVTCLVAKATNDEAVLWHRRLGHVNFKNINKLVQGNLVRGLPSKTFKLDHSCLACKKGKQHRDSCKKVEERTIREPLELLHMDLFGPVSVESVNKKKYCLVVTDDCSKFSWVFFLAYKDETYDMLHDLIVGLENRLRHKVKTIRCDHGTEFKNQLMNEFYAKKGIKREYSIARTPQQNGVAERKNRTLIEAARTMLADSLLPIQFWAEAVNTACYVLNRVLINWVSLMASQKKAICWDTLLAAKVLESITG
ncbi:putative ribonuclease H-like domain-containing protein [Tanacetum coccineum]